MKKAEILSVVENFVKSHKRLPMLAEDDLIFKTTDKNNEEVDRPLRASIQLKEVYGDKNIKEISNLLLTDLIKYDILDYEDIREICNIEKSVGMELLLSGERKTLEVKDRRALEVFLGYDMYEHLEPKVAKLCESCSRNGNSCKNPQLYWVTVVGCNRYARSKRK